MSDPSPPPYSNGSSPPPRNADHLRFMCSYGGHILPRPHHMSLCYVGGGTRLLAVDRHTSLADLSARLSKTLLGNRPFSLKYQIPHEDLDSLISVSSDEDLENMIDEYDRMAANTSNPSAKPSRLMLFLFPWKPESTQSIGTILESSDKTEEWFLDALNGTGLLNRGFSDSASVNCLLGLDDDVAVAVSDLDSGAREVDASQTSSFENGKSLKRGQDIHSIPDSSMLDTASSFGSTSSLPRIRVHVDPPVMLGLEFRMRRY